MRRAPTPVPHHGAGAARAAAQAGKSQVTFATRIALPPPKPARGAARRRRRRWRGPPCVGRARRRRPARRRVADALPPLPKTARLALHVIPPTPSHVDGRPPPPVSSSSRPQARPRRARARREPHARRHARSRRRRRRDAVVPRARAPHRAQRSAGAEGWPASARSRYADRPPRWRSSRARALKLRKRDFAPVERAVEIRRRRRHRRGAPRALPRGELTLAPYPGPTSPSTAKSAPTRRWPGRAPPPAHTRVRLVCHRRAGAALHGADRAGQGDAQGRRPCAISLTSSTNSHPQSAKTVKVGRRREGGVVAPQ